MTFTVAAVVEALYRTALDRRPDESGLSFYGGRLEADPTQLLDIAGEIYRSDEHQRLQPEQSGLADHSQFGELGKLLNILVRQGSRHQLIVDVGARGRDRSNSYDLLKSFGWNGLLVEANPALHQQIRAEFEGLRFVLEPCAVGPEEGTMPFYIGANDDVSSLDPKAAGAWGALRGSVEVPVRRLSSLLDQHRVPTDFDILSLDIEGMDVRVFNDLITNSEYRPRIVVIEAAYNGTTKRLSDVGVDPKACDLYSIVDITHANLILSLQG